MSIDYTPKLIDLLHPYFSNYTLELEVRFHPTRRWRFDVAIHELKLAFEIEGGTWRGGRHVNPIGFAKDCEKYNEAVKRGWKVFRLVPSMLNEEYFEELFLENE